MSRPWRLRWLIPVTFLLACGCQPAEPSLEERLLEKQRRREQAQLARPRSDAERLQEAERFLADGNVVEAQRELRPLLVAEPDNLDYLLLAARCEAAAGNKRRAAEMLDGLVPGRQPRALEAICLSAQWLADDLRFRAAEERLQSIVAVAPDHAPAHRRLATLLNNQGRRREAAVHLRQLAKLGDISEKELFALNTIGDPFIDITVQKPDFGSRLVPAALAEAKRLRADGDVLAARELTERLAKAFPDATPIAAFQGRIYAELQLDARLDRWLTTLPEQIEIEPEYWFALGKRLQRASAHPQAVRCFCEAVLRDPTDRFSYQAMAASLTACGKQRAAQAARERFERLETSARLASEIGAAPPTSQTLHQMADLMESLHRPWEALAWRSFAVKKAGGSAKQLQALEHRRRDLLESGEAPPEHFATCGVAPSDWPRGERGDVRAAAGLSVADRAAGSPPPSAETIRLVDASPDVGLDFLYRNGDDPSDQAWLLHQTTGGGIGILDFDLDGWPDLYLVQSDGQPFASESSSEPNRLWRNLAGKRLVEITEPAGTGDRGYGQGVAAADLNQDGFPDLVVANIGRNRIYLNRGDGTFAEADWFSADQPDRWTTTVACGDLSGDHLPEIIEINYVDDPRAFEIPCTPQSDVCNPSEFLPAVDRFWRLEKNGRVSLWNGCRDSDRQPNYGFGAVVANFDRQAGNDLFVANDTKVNQYWVSKAGAESEHQLTESAPLFGCSSGLRGQPNGCMGVAAGDFDRNGWLDLHVTNYWEQAADLYLQQPGGLFSNQNAARGLYHASRKTVGWGTQAVDFDRDGWLDLAVANGHVTDHRKRGVPFRMKPQLFRGSAAGFGPLPFHGDADYWNRPALGRAMATWDWNRDLRPDLVIGHLFEPTVLLENRTQAGHAVTFELVGTRSERDAVGAEVRLEIGEHRWTGWQTGGDGFLCSNQATIDFGLGSATRIDRVTVLWPSGGTQTIRDLAVDTAYLVVEGCDAVDAR